MLRRWVDHYSREVGAENLVVVDDNSSDGSTDDLPCPVLRIPPLTQEVLRAGPDGAARRPVGRPARGVRRSDLLRRRRVHRRRPEGARVAAPLRRRPPGPPGGRRDGAQRRPRRRLGNRRWSTGEPILGQRRLAKFLPLMCKPSLKWEPANWALASHGIKCPFEVDPELFMFHMKFADRDHLKAVADHRHEMFRTDGRAARTSWERSGGDMVDLLDEITADIDHDDDQAVRPAAEEAARHRRAERARRVARGRRRPGAGDAQPPVRPRPRPVPRPGVSCRPSTTCGSTTRASGSSRPTTSCATCPSTAGASGPSGAVATRAPTVPAGWSRWPERLTLHLDGVTQLEHHPRHGDVVFDDEVRFGTSPDRVTVVGPRRRAARDRHTTAGWSRRSRPRTRASSSRCSTRWRPCSGLLHAEGLEAFPAYGTLLGAVRDGAFIGHDSDADVGYVSRHTHPLDVIRESHRVQRAVAAAGLPHLAAQRSGVQDRRPRRRRLGARARRVRRLLRRATTWP